ncbi:Clp protease ClpP [Methylomonas montana]|uniref:ClpP-like prohead protease/major capsid protein fusion protein n=1 Tax=Methylomonas montana TaxID=3058963 RepID=UPI0026583418|nr:ClpP-like prohead protease/major capsid protein fusion protein [Methylomonas montana]WKJ91631.1 Clp protease ClpP [Methylomonas montana]
MADLYLYDGIGPGSAKNLIDGLNKIKGSVVLRINSGGGSVFEGLAIYNAIQRRGQVTVKIDGLAASIASLIAMAGNRTEMAENALLMIHNPWSDTSGDSADLRKQAELLDKAKTSMLSAYAGRTGKPEAEISQIMDAETWFTAEEALQHKLIDAIYQPLSMAAQYVGIEHFNLPDRIKAMTTASSSTTQPATNHADVQAQLAELATIKADQKRRDDISNYFASVNKSFPGVATDDLLKICLSKSTISLDAAREIFMTRLGTGQEPIMQTTVRINPQSGQVEEYHPRASFGPNAHHGEFMEAAVDALMLKNNIRPAKPHPAARDVMGMSLTDMARTMVGQAGGTIRRGLFGIRQETSGDVIKAALTTSDFPLLLENVASKSLMHGYDTEPASHRLWVNQTDVPDFKTQKRVALSEAPDLELVNERGEYRHGAMQEKGEGFALQTFGKIISLTRQMIINDDLNAFTKIPNALGRSASRLEADKVYAILTGNPTMADAKALFHADHHNLMTAAALSITSLGAARAAMRKQQGMQGAILNIVPRFLIVPAALESEAEQLVSSLVDPTKQNATPQHAWIRGLEIVVDARLDASNDKSWYLAADFNQVDTIEVAYLQGQRGAFIDQEEHFDSDALKIKCRLDFQAAAIDWIGLIKNPGA